jgi:hypothetical protein
MTQDSSHTGHRQLRADDVGKPVRSADGVTLGTLVEVRERAAYVQPRDGLLDGYGSVLGSCWDPRGCFELDQGAVDRVAADAVRVDLLVGLDRDRELR